MTSTPPPDLAFAARVARGAALLDEMVPGWDQRIDLDYLQMEDGRECVLGQTFDSSLFALELMGIDDPEAYGFDLAEGEDETLWPTVNAMWRALIVSRRPASG